jgi:Zn-finger nucleic acid-binding protein
MKCPVDDAVLQMSNRDGIEIDYCPTCRGVWLDRGELDKIIERNSNSAPALPQQNMHSSRPPQQHHDYDDDDDYKFNGHGYGHQKKRKKSFLDDIFDF